MAIKKFETEIGGKKLTIETGKLAGQTNGACTVRYGDTVVLATAVMSQEPRESVDYLPLLVDYEERLYAAGKIKGSRFIKREGRPTDEAILTGRMVDRCLRPLFPKGITNDIQVVITVLSVDQENDPDILSLIAASCALEISNIPFNGPLAGVRVGQIPSSAEGKEPEWVLNPTYEARRKSLLDLVVAGSGEKAVMIEAGAKEVSEETIVSAIEFSRKHLKKIISLIDEVKKEVGAEKMALGSEITLSEEEKAVQEKLVQKVTRFMKDKVKEVFKEKAKEAQDEVRAKLKEELNETLKADNEVSKENRAKGLAMIDNFIEKEVGRLILEEEKRVDGRRLDEIRPLAAEAGFLPRTHGSALFSRGETQILSIVTLGSPGEELFLDTMEESGRKRFMHHYNFPGFSVGEVSPIRSPGRREIGHGALVEKALVSQIPDKEQFSYTVRVVSEVLSSNGSTSMASCSGASLALMDAGVPIRKPVAGISMGLVLDEKSGKYKVLADIQGLEDFGGGMDFKVAGTKDGITAMQVDIKVSGLTLEIIREALAGAKIARHKILEVMAKALAEPRKEMSPYAPRIYNIRINPEKIREVIGKGGETINKIIDECGGQDVIKIDIEDDGLIMITSHEADQAQKAMTWIQNLTREIEVGEIFEGVVTQIMKDRRTGSEIGAIVELIPGQDGMVHISQFSDRRIDNVSSIVKVGQKLKVKVTGVDKERGRIELSVKALNSNLSDREDSSGFPQKRGRGSFRDRF